MDLVLSGEDLSRQLKGTCWKLKSQCISRLDQPTRYSNQLDFKCDFPTLHPHYIYTLITHKIIRRLFKRKPQRGFYNTHHSRESYSSLSENSLQSLLLPLSHCHTLKRDCTQTQFTPIQNVESVLELENHWVFAKINR